MKDITIKNNTHTIKTDDDDDDEDLGYKIMDELDSFYWLAAHLRCSHKYKALR